MAFTPVGVLRKAACDKKQKTNLGSSRNVEKKPWIHGISKDIATLATKV